MRNFDRFIAIDWSGAKSPVLTPSIAVSSLSQGESSPHIIDGPWSRDKVAAYIVDLSKTSKERIIIGIDCNFGYAAMVAQKQFGQDITALQLWQNIDDICADTPNFFAGNFWTHPSISDDFWISGKRRADFMMPKREAEKACDASGFGNPESPFKLIGAKQVGKGGLSGMRMAHYLKTSLGDKIAFWPFEIDKVNQAQIVVTEIYPRQFIMRAGQGTQKIRARDDLNKCLLFLGAEPYKNTDQFTDHDTDALVSAAGLKYLCNMDKKEQKNIPKAISHPSIMSYTAQNLEGWIFGITG